MDLSDVLWVGGAQGAGKSSIAEGPQLLPSLVAPLVGARDQALFLVPSRERQHETLAARGSMALTSDPAAARAKLAGRNALIAGRIAAEARELGLPVLEADRDLDAMIELAVERLAPAIARGPHGGDLAAVRRFENDVLALTDGRFGFGQVMGEEAMQLGLAKVNKQGVAVVGLRNSGHLGRIGDWALMAARANKLALHFVNTSGGGILAAPFGGTSRRLSANPIAAAVPVKNGPPILLDISTCAIAEGKVRVAFNKGVSVPDNCLLDGQGRPTNDPKAFYANPPGAILPFGAHKGYGLSIIVEMLAGALTGGSCSNPQTRHVANNMLTILMDPAAFPADYLAERRQTVARYREENRSQLLRWPGGREAIRKSFSRAGGRGEAGKGEQGRKRAGAGPSALTMAL